MQRTKKPEFNALQDAYIQIIEYTGYKPSSDLWEAISCLEYICGGEVRADTAVLRRNIHFRDEMARTRYRQSAESIGKYIQKQDRSF